MPSVTRCTRIITDLTGIPTGEVAKIARRLIDAKFLPKSSGRDIKDVTPAQFLVLLGTVALSRKPAQDIVVATELQSLPLAAEDCENEFFPNVIGSRLAFARNDGWPEICDHRAELNFHRSPNGLSVSFTEEGDDMRLGLEFWRSKSWGGYTRNTFTVSSEGVHYIARQFKLAGNLEELAAPFYKFPAD